METRGGETVQPAGPATRARRRP